MNTEDNKENGLDRFLRLREVVAVTGLSPATIWRRERAGDFPRRRQISPGAVGWLASEVRAWMEGRQYTQGTPPPPERDDLRRPRKAGSPSRPDARGD